MASKWNPKDAEFAIWEKFRAGSRDIMALSVNAQGEGAMPKKTIISVGSKTILQSDSEGMAMDRIGRGIREIERIADAPELDKFRKKEKIDGEISQMRETLRNNPGCADQAKKLVAELEAKIMEIDPDLTSGMHRIFD